MARGFMLQVAKDAPAKDVLDVFCAEYYFGMEDDVGCDYFCDLDAEEVERCIHDFLELLEERGIDVDYTSNSFTMGKESKLKYFSDTFCMLKERVAKMPLEDFTRSSTAWELESLIDDECGDCINEAYHTCTVDHWMRTAIPGTYYILGAVLMH